MAPRCSGRNPAALLAAALLAVSGLHVRQSTVAGQAPPQTPPTFRAGVNLVALEVSVVDKDDHPVTGLTSADFTVLDNGQPRPIAAFSVVDLPDLESASANWMDTTSPDVESNQFAARRLVVLAFVEHIGPADFSLADSFHRVGHAIVANLGPADEATVVNVARPGAAQGFTTDRARLNEAVDLVDYQAVPDITGNFPFDRLIDVVNALGEIHGVRKVMFFLTGGVGVFPRSERDRFYHAAERANVTIDCINVVFSLFSPDRTCHEIAGETNGTVVSDRNDPEAEVPALFRADQSFYLIGFEPTADARTGIRRRISVKVDRPGVEVRTKNEYTPTTAADAAGEPALDGPLPVTSLPLQISAMPVAGATTGSVPVIIALTVGQPNVRSDYLRVNVTAFDAADVQELEGQESVRWSPRAAPGESRQGTIFARADLTPGFHRIRAAVQSIALKETGSVVTEVDVPDFAKARLSLSGVVVHSDLTETVGGTDTLRGLVPSVPTTRRMFATTEHVTAALAVYQSATAAKSDVTLVTRITDAHDAIVFDRSESLTASHFGVGRHAESTVALPLETLPAGRYLLSFAATTPTDRAERDVQFTVR